MDTPSDRVWASWAAEQPHEAGQIEMSPHRSFCPPSSYLPSGSQLYPPFSVPGDTQVALLAPLPCLLLGCGSAMTLSQQSRGAAGPRRGEVGLAGMNSRDRPGADLQVLQGEETKRIFFSF